LGFLLPSSPERQEVVASSGVPVDPHSVRSIATKHNQTTSREVHKEAHMVTASTASALVRASRTALDDNHTPQLWLTLNTPPQPTTSQGILCAHSIRLHTPVHIAAAPRCLITATSPVTQRGGCMVLQYAWLMLSTRQLTYTELSKGNLQPWGVFIQHLERTLPGAVSAYHMRGSI
jgi:hypothetical protein